jgi:hypothetical protein
MNPPNKANSTTQKAARLISDVGRGTNMNEDEYKDFVAKANSGALLIGIDRATARQFYMDIPLSKIEEETGEAPYFQKMIVWSAYLAAPIALLASFALAVFALRWWAAIAIPLSVVVYFVYSAQSSMPSRGMLGISLLLALASGIFFTDFFNLPFVTWYAFSIVLALWASRLVYCASTALLRAFVLRNIRAFEFMAEHIHMREAGN